MWGGGGGLSVSFSFLLFVLYGGCWVFVYYLLFVVFVLFLFVVVTTHRNLFNVHTFTEFS